MAETIYNPETDGANPSLAQLARMAEYEREFWLRYWTGGDKPTEDQLAPYLVRVISAEYETLKGKVANRQIYFVQAETGQIKIGIANNVAKRFSNLRGSSPVALKLLLTVPGGINAECELHHQFREHRLHGEWFRPHPDILEKIALLKEGV